MTHVEIVRTAYPLAPNNGHASETSVRIVDHIGVVATLDPLRHLVEANAMVMAAALEGCPVHDVQVERLYRYRDNRNAVAESSVTATESRVRFARGCAITKAQYDSLIWSNLYPAERLAATLASIAKTLDGPHHQTFELTTEIMDAADAS